jgi:N4-gp56 family major capsid protein
MDVEDAYVKTLNDHAARTINQLIKAELVSGRSYTYVPLTATTADYNTDGTVTSEAAVAFKLWHVQNLAKSIKKSNMAPADGQNYFMAASPTLEFDILQDAGVNGFVDVKKYASGGAEGILDNEIGKVGKFRIVCDNHALDDGVGAGSAFGTAYFVGYEGVKELMVYPVHLRYNGNIGDDFGNLRGIAWQCLCGWKTIWDHDTHGQGSVGHVGST